MYELCATYVVDYLVNLVTMDVVVNRETRNHNLYIQEKLDLRERQEIEVNNYIYYQYMYVCQWMFMLI